MVVSIPSNRGNHSGLVTTWEPYQPVWRLNPLKSGQPFRHALNEEFERRFSVSIPSNRGNHSGAEQWFADEVSRRVSIPSNRGNHSGSMSSMHENYDGEVSIPSNRGNHSGSRSIQGVRKEDR